MMDLIDLYICEDSNIIEAMKKLDKSTKQILFIVKDKKLVASLTDGDIRRHLLKGGKLEDVISKASNYNPKYIFERDVEHAQKVMKENRIYSIPVVNEYMEIVTVIFLNEFSIFLNEHLDLPVVIMAGGKGTRLYPYTKILPKPLIPIGDLPIVEHIMNKFMEFGCYDFHYVVNHKKQMIKAYFAETDKKYSVTFYEEDIPLGTGGGLSLLKGKINKPFVVTNCDIILRADYNDIFKFHKESKNIITMVCAYKHFTIPYGVITMGENGEIMHMTEKPEYSFLTNTGFYIVEPEVLDYIEENIAISFPDIIDGQRAKNRKVSIYPVSEKSCLDMGQLTEMEEMRKELGV